MPGAHRYAFGMSARDEVLAVEQRFFDALVAGDAGALDELLLDDFLIVDVMMGSVVPKGPFIGAVAEGHVTFQRIDREEADVRLYGDAAVVVGRTRMAGKFGGTPFEASSRYTHVFIKQGSWRMASAQGTQIVEGSLRNAE